MKIKNILKIILGPQLMSKIKGVVYHYIYSILIRIKGDKKLNYDKTTLKYFTLITDKNYHYFRGYYDLVYFNNSNDKLICHRLPTNAKSNKDSICDLGYFDIKEKKYIKVAESRTWCWQQGCRLRWNPMNENQIIFNICEDNEYKCRVFDIKENKVVKDYEIPLYDITNDMKYGIGLNFSRLQRLRPGYGYDYISDSTTNQNAPIKDGIFLLDMNKNEYKLLYSLKDLAKKVIDGDKYIHYINHISVAPDNEKFIFFHIYKGGDIKEWKTILYVSDIKGNSLIKLEEEDRVSHYCWIDSIKIMVTCHKENGEEYYAIYNINSNEKKVINISGLEVDGHPLVLGNKSEFITDTYPKIYGYQSIYSFNLGDKKVSKKAQIYHDYRTRGSKRCDLHPSISNDEKYLTVDTTMIGNRRSILVFELKNRK